MKYKCCECTMSYFMITHDTLSFCCRLGKAKNAFIENYKGETNFIEKYYLARTKHIDNCKENKGVPQKCINCYQYKEENWQENIKIKFLGVANRTKCSCNCIYCTSTEGETQERKNLNTQEIWDIKPVLETIQKNDLIDEDCLLFIAGGECSEYPKDELKWLINFAKENKMKIQFASSGMFFSKEIEETLKKDSASIVISTDSGKKETYEKIKRVRYYNQVWNNIKKYSKACSKNPNSYVSVKYIILEGINDTIEEFDIFMKKCNEVKCQKIYISVDLDWLIKDGGKNKNSSPNTFKLLNYINNLNDERIYTDMYIDKVTTKTSAKVYSEEIENLLKTKNTLLNIIVFSGKKDTYYNLTKTNDFENIWENIKSYADLVKDKPAVLCSIKMQYKFIIGKNDSLDEINAFLLKCKENNIKEIEFDIAESKLNEETSKGLLQNLKEVISYLKTHNDFYISFSQKIHEIVEEN